MYIPVAPIVDAGARGAGGVVTGLTPLGAASRRARRILIIEDEPDLVRGLRDALEFEGFEVVSSGLGREGVRLLRERGPDLVLLDLMLPDANGFAVCEEIRSTHPLVPVIMLTARSQETDKIRGLDVGRRRLRHQALLGRRAGRAHQRHLPAPAPRAAAPTRRSRDRRRRHRPAQARADAQREDRARCRSTRSSSCACCGSAPGSRSRARRSWRRSGACSGHATTRSVDNFVVKLRKKIEENAAKPRHIVTIYGTGYKLVV